MRYLGRVDAGGGTSSTVALPPSDAPHRFAYHGSRDRLSGTPVSSEEGTFGAGFYLTTEDRAADYATYDPRFAADPPEARPPPQHHGTVYAFDISALRLKVVESHLAYFDLVDALLGQTKGYATPQEKARVQELLAAEGYDGLDIRDVDRTEIVIFPSSVPKLGISAATAARYHYMRKPRRRRG